jgi:tetratricopeptide (TPR) repeat protein
VFGWLRPRCPVDPELKLWIERRMAWLTDRFGWDHLLARPVILPSDEYFPDPYEPTEQGARTVLDRLCVHIGIDPDEVDLAFYSNQFAPKLEAGFEAIGLYETIDGRHHVAVEERQILEPAHLAATLTHELGHAILLSQGHLHGSEPDHEPLIDLFTVFQGLGVLSANAVLRDTNYWTDGMCRTGYLSFEAFSYAMALFTWVRQEKTRGWEAALRGDVRTLFKKGRGYLEKTEDSTFSRSMALRAEWLVAYPVLPAQESRVSENGNLDRSAEASPVANDELEDESHHDAFTHGIVAMNAKDYSEAIARFTDAIEEDSEDAEAYLHRGEAYLSLGGLDSALDDACSCMELDADDLDGVFLRGRVFFHLGDLEDAIADFEYLIQEEGRGIEALSRKWRGHYWLGRVFAVQGETKSALTAFSRAVNFAPTEVDPFIHRSRLFEQMGQEAEACADREMAYRLNGEVAEMEFGPPDS